MHLHDVGYDKFDIACEDTLTAPQHWDDEPFELIVSNPPYSIKWAGDDIMELTEDECGILLKEIREMKKTRETPTVSSKAQILVKIRR